MQITKKLDQKLEDFYKNGRLGNKPSKILIGQNYFDLFVKEWEPFLIDFDEAKKVNSSIKNNNDIEYKGITIEIVPENDVLIVI